MFQLVSDKVSCRLGPYLLFASSSSAAVQLPETSHSFIVQHLRRVKVVSADEVTFRCGRFESGRDLFSDATERS